MLKKITIIGTSRITSHHILAARRVGFDIFAIASSRKNSKYLQALAKKNNIKNIFYSWKQCIVKSIQSHNDISFIITAPTFKNKSILEFILNYDSKILIEKPVFNNVNDFIKLNKNKKNIFVGYNRIFYEHIIYLKKKLKNKNNLNVICNLPEENRQLISNNSCHIFSILFYLFGDLKFIKKIKNKNFINVYLNSENAQISMFFNFKASENFTIKIYDKKIIYELFPIEKLTIYKNMKVLNINNQNYYEPRKTYFKNYNLNKIKPGFYNQYVSFLKFIKNKEIKNNIDFACNIQKLISRIL
jgi:predicted dehydrogenase